MNAEVIVVGGGVNGLWTLHDLTSRGVKAILFEQFPYPHTRGSSHGQSRIIRTAYQREEYSALMPEAYRKWKQLEKQSKKTLLLKTSLVTLYNMDTSSDGYHSMVKNMRKYEPDHETFPGKDLEFHFQGMFAPPNWNVILDRGAGILRADACLEALRNWCINNGAEIHGCEQVVSIRPVNDHEVIVETPKGKYRSQSVVLTCGTFINKLSSTVDFHVPIQPTKASVFYWKDKNPPTYSMSNNFPSLVAMEDPVHFYTIPSYEYPGLMKICYHGSGHIADPTLRDWDSAELKKVEDKMLAWLKEKTRIYLPQIDTSSPAIHEVCMYTKSPDDRFILDTHPKYKNIVIGTGFSGHGFKTSPSVGHILANMALGQQSPYPLGPFSLDRFRKSKL